MAGATTSKISNSEKPLVQAELSIPQEAESFRGSFERAQGRSVSDTELHDLVEDPRTKQNGKERTTTVALDNSEASEVRVDSTGTYENLYPTRRSGQVITGLADYDTGRLISHVLPDQKIEARTPPTLALLQSYGATAESPSALRWRHTALLGLILLCLAGALGFGGWLWWSRSSSPAATSTESHTRNEVAVQEKPSNPPQSLPIDEPTRNTGADEELAALRDTRIKAKPSERGQVVAGLEDAERTYPNDYRFPYELAKVTIVGVHSHDESFAALIRAAEVAIDNGKTKLMMENLMADKSGDLRKLSHGHLEWSMVEEALRTGNKAALKTLHNNSSDDH